MSIGERDGAPGLQTRLRSLREKRGKKLRLAFVSPEDQPPFSRSVSNA
jgi:hypothetical protein